MRKTPVVAVLATALFWAAPSHAQVIAADDFEGYAAGSQLAGQSGGSGFVGSWEVNAGRADAVTIIAANMSYANGEVLADGGSRALQFEFDPAEGGGITDGIMVRALEAAQTGTVYMSLLFRDTVNPDFATDFIQWGFSNGTTNPQASLLRRNGSLQLRSTTVPNNSVDSGIAASVGPTHLLVFKAEKTGAGNYDRLSFFVDPDSAVEPVTASAFSTVDCGLASFPNFVARSAFHGGGDTFQIDNLLIGASWEDVVPSTLPAPFMITAVSYDGTEVELTWNSRNRYLYAVFASDDLEEWWELTDSELADGPSASYTVTGNDAVAPGGKRFFRVEERGRVLDDP